LITTSYPIKEVTFARVMATVKVLGGTFLTKLGVTAISLPVRASTDGAGSIAKKSVDNAMSWKRTFAGCMILSITIAPYQI
jgi:hypothetical protein